MIQSDYERVFKGAKDYIDGRLERRDKSMAVVGITGLCFVCGYDTFTLDGVAQANVSGV